MEDTRWAKIVGVLMAKGPDALRDLWEVDEADLDEHLAAEELEQLEASLASCEAEVARLKAEIAGRG